MDILTRFYFISGCGNCVFKCIVCQHVQIFTDISIEILWHCMKQLHADCCNVLGKYLYRDHHFIWIKLAKLLCKYSMIFLIPGWRGFKIATLQIRRAVVFNLVLTCIFLKHTAVSCLLRFGITSKYEWKQWLVL